jgi:hypothetical protein
VAACERYDQDQKARRYDGFDEGLYNEMIRQEPTTKRIIAELDPNLADINVRAYLGAPPRRRATRMRPSPSCRTWTR